MTDIVERLRNRWWVCPTDMEQRITEEANEAADEITRLRSLNKELAEALKLCVAVIENGADDLGAKQAAIAALKKAGAE